MSASNAPGIKQLLEAERRAGEVVRQARNRKVQRMKQAKDEADAEIAAFKVQLDNEIVERKQANEEGKAGATDKIKEDTTKQLDSVVAACDAHKDEVISTLVGIVTSVKCMVHENYGKDLNASA